MAAAPGKKKPPTPPKPPLGRLLGQGLAENLCDSSKERNTQSGEKDCTTEKQTLLLKSKNEAASNQESNTNVIKCSNDKPLVKPPLLPKPQTPPKPLATSPKSLSRNSKPLIPKRPYLVIPLERNGKKPATSSTARLPNKAPVAKLDEFDSFCDVPIRPPRSPKSQPFKGEPFKVFGEKPELPLKKKQINCDGSNFERLHSQWQTTKEKSASLGRANAFRYVEAKSKSASLGRNKNIDLSAFASAETKLEKGFPVPPPRQRKKVCEHSCSIPVYAQVNYSMKKNRRQDVEVECTKCNEEEIEEVEEIIEGKLVLPGRKGSMDKEKSEEISQVEGKYYKQMNVEEVSVQEINCESSVQIVNGCVISEDKISGVSALDVISIDNEVCSLVSNRTLENSVESVDDPSILCSKILSEDTSTNTVTESNDSQISHEIKVDEDGDDNVEKSPAENKALVTSKESESADCHVEIGVSIAEEIVSDELARKDIGRDSSLNLSVADEECSIEVPANQEYYDEVFVNEEIADGKLFKQDDSECLTISEKSSKTLTTDQECRLSTSSLPVRRKLIMKEPGKFHRRRQSWSSSKDESPSPVKPPHNKRKVKSRSWWCDDGELSSGALGDLDSSDNTARQSSFEEVDWTGSDVEDYSPVRSKLSCWFGSFGKGGRKHKQRRDSNSQFYCDSQLLSSEAKNSCEVVPEKCDVETEVFSPIQDGSRPASGLSTRSNIDMDQSCDAPDAPVSEESFEMYHHSDSENEADPSAETNDKIHSESEESRLNKKAFYIAQELMTSERVFIDVLKLLNVDFKNAVHAASSDQRCSVIPDTELSKILNSLPQLQHLNEDLLRDLEQRIENWSSIKKISDVIVRKGPFLKLYTSYIKNFELQCSYLEECCQKYPRFAKVLKEFEASPRCQKLSLKHYMLKPVQRIPQYRLLLEDYLHHLSPSSPDLEDTKAALKIVCDVADHANRSIKLGDHLSKLLQLQSQLGNYEIIKPGRMFIKDGELFKLSRKGMQPRYFILLNDCLLYTSYYGTVQSSGLKVNYELPLSSMKVNLPQSEDYHNEFSIISVRRSFTLCARSLKERQEWVDALQKAISDYVSRQLSFQNMKITSSSGNEKSSETFKLGEEAPVWIQDSRVTMCQSCTAVFTVTFRRHHCRGCGKVVCGDCSDFRAPLQYMKFQSARICEECHDMLLKEARDPSSKLNQAMRRELGNTVKITDTFKRLGPASGKKIKKYIPQRLKEVTANDTGSQMSGWLHRKSRRSWKRLWFVLKEQVLYVYKASEDVVALQSLPVLGYSVEAMKDRHFQLYEGVNAKLVFQLAHPGQQPLIFYADNEHLANRWIAAMNDATVLK